MNSGNLRGLLSGSALFGVLPEAMLEQVAAKLQLVTFKLGETVLRQGQPGEALYVVGQGKVRIVDDSGEKSVTLAVLNKGDSFGERSLLHGEPVSATVRAAGSVVLHKLLAMDFLPLLEAHPELRQRVEEAVSRQREFNFLRTQNLLAGLTPAETQKLVAAVETVSLAPGEALFHEGDAGDAMYLVRDGSLKVIKESLGGQLLGRKPAGSLLGEMALLNDAPRTAAAIAETATTVLKLHRDAFNAVVAGKEGVLDLLSEQASRHLLQQEAILASTAEAEQADRKDSGHEIRVGRIRPRGWLFGSVPLALTTNPLFSGIACLVMAAQTSGRTIQWQTLVEGQLQVGSVDDLHSLGRKVESAGLLSRLVKVDFERLRDLLMPAAVRTAEGTLAVIFRITATEVMVGDPLKGLLRIPAAEFRKTFDGQVLTITYVPDFGAIGNSVSGIYRQFLPMLGPHWGLVARIGVVMVLIQLLGLLPAFFSETLIDNVLVTGDWNLLWLMLLGLLVATFVGSVAGAVREFLTLHLIRRMSATLFVRFFAHILALPLTTLNRWETGALLARFEENEKFLETASDGAIRVLSDAAGLLIYVPVLFLMSWKLALIAMIFLFAMVIAIIVATPRFRAFERLQFQTSSDKDSHIIEVVTSVETVKALGQERQFAERGRGYFDRNIQAEMLGERFDNHFEIVTDIIQDGSTIAVIAVGATMVLSGEMTAGGLIAFAAILGAVMEPAEALANFYDEFLELKIALDRLNDVLGSPREAVNAERPCPALKGGLRFEGVSFRYSPDGRNALTNIDLEIQPGQKVAFVGRSGSGKTTLLSLVNRMLESTSGAVFVDGVDISKVDLVSLRQQIGVVEQFPYLFSGTVRENIAKANPGLPLESVVAAATLAGVGEFVDRLPMRYDTRIGEGGRSLSGGQSQRMVIARALAANPRILVLDEATSALDTESERIIQKNLDGIMKGRTTLVIAHRLSTIRNADLIVVMDAGSIAEKGTHEELMEKKGLYHYLATRSR